MEMNSTLRQYFHTLWRQLFLKLGLDISFRKGILISIPNTKEACVISLFVVLHVVSADILFTSWRHSKGTVMPIGTDFRDQIEGGHRTEGRKTSNSTVNLSFCYSSRTLTCHYNRKVTQYRWGFRVNFRLLCAFTLLRPHPHKIDMDLYRHFVFM